MSGKAASLTESVIREMTRLALASDAINLAQGFPDFPAPAEVKRAACAAIEADINQYPITWGSPSFRAALTDKYRRDYQMSLDPERQLCVTCGATEAMIAAIIAIADPGDEIIIFEPFYENYGSDAVIAGATPHYVTLHEPDWALNETELAAAFSDRTRAIVLNNPNNPTGKVFSRAELMAIGRLCEKFGVVAISDEIYEHIVYDGARHIPMATIPGMEDRTITVSALSKTYSVTGWRVGWTIAPPAETDAIRRVHDFLTVGAPAPLQEAGAAALRLPASYYTQLADGYQQRRDLMLEILQQAGFRPVRPAGAYYTMTDISALRLGDDQGAARRLVSQARVAAVPGSSFYSRPELGTARLRFSFSKRLETLREAGARLAEWAGREDSRPAADYGGQRPRPAERVAQESPRPAEGTGPGHSRPADGPGKEAHVASVQDASGRATPAPSAKIYPTARQEKPWGYELIFAAVSDKYAGKVIHVNAGHSLSLQYHREKDETISVLDGEALIEYGPAAGELTEQRFGAGDTIHLPPGVLHRVRAVSDLTFAEASTAGPGWRDDVVRLEDRYGRSGTSAP